jgi:hypothetical protein
MEQVEVGISKAGMVMLSQESTVDEPDVILLHPSQIEVVCQWLREARDEALEAISRGELPEGE